MNQQDPKRALEALLRSPDGKRLISLLGRDGGNAMRQAASALQSGDEAQAKAAMEPMLQSQEVQALLQSMAQAMDRG